MKTLFYCLVFFVLVSCDADTTELPGVEREPQKLIPVSLFGQPALELTLYLDPDNPGITKVIVSNKSTVHIKELGFFLEYCETDGLDNQKCSTYPVSTSNLSQGRSTSSEISRYVDLTKEGISIYVTKFVSDNYQSHAIAGRYGNSIVTITDNTSNPAVVLKGNGVAYIRADGSLFCRTGLSISATPGASPVIYEMKGKIDPNNNLVVEDIGKNPNLLYYGSANITNKLLSASVPLSNGTKDILLGLY